MHFVLVIYPSVAAATSDAGVLDFAISGVSFFGLNSGYLSVSGKTIPVLPSLMRLSPISREIDLQKRSASYATAQAVLANPGISLLASKAINDFIRVRIYSAIYDGERYDLSAVIFDGFITNISADEVRGYIVLEAAEFDDRFGQPFPPDVITRADFPNAPNEVVGVFSRQVVIGRFDAFIPARQIDRDGMVFYICDPPLTLPPSVVVANGNIVGQANYFFTTLNMASSGLPYTALVFNAPVSSIVGGTVTYVAVAGGVGLQASNAVGIIAKTQGIPLSRRARAISRTFDFDFPISVLLNKRDSGVAILLRRIFPQTVYIPAVTNGEIDLIPVGDFDSPNFHLRPGDGFLVSQAGIRRSGYGDVINSIQINVGMTHFGGQQLRRPLLQVVRSPTSGPLKIRSRCKASQALYGPRFITIDAGDLGVVMADPFTPVRSPSAERLADHIIMLSAFESLRYSYLVTDSAMGMLELGDVVRIDDPIIPRSPQNFVVVKKTYDFTPSIDFELIV